MGLADLHIHTIHSWDGTCTVAAVLKQAADSAGLDVIAITDHDVFEGALEAQQLASRYGIEVIPGCEVSSAEGHLLCLFLNAPVPAGLPLIETALIVAEQGGLCIPAHPMAVGTSSITPKILKHALAHPQASQVIVGLEAYNAGLVYGRSNPAAQALAIEHNLALVGSSDAHTAWGIGRGLTGFAGRSAADLRQALVQRQTYVLRGRERRYATVGSWLFNIALRRAGWVTANLMPQAPLRLHRERLVQTHV